MNSDLFNNIDVDSWRWPKYGLSDDELRHCRNNVRRFASDYYKGEVDQIDSVEQLFLDSYLVYLSVGTNVSDARKNELLARAKRIIKEYGWGTFESTSLEQGWWHFMNWVINQSKLDESLNISNNELRTLGLLINKYGKCEVINKIKSF